MMEKIKAWMDKPYTKGDAYGGVAVCLAIYALLGAAYVAYAKVKEWKSNRKIKKTEEEYISPFIEEDEA